MKNKILTGLLGFFAAILIITFSIGLPIYFRPFYYAQVDLYIEDEYNELVDQWQAWAEKYYKDEDYVKFEKLSADEIKAAYNEVLDYLTIPGKDFGTGKLPYREWTETHFADCKFLFDLNAGAFIVSLIGIAVLIFLNKKAVFQLWKPFKMSILFCTGAFSLGGFAVIGGLAAIDFDKAFEVFHQIFFPGKENWVFHPVYDRVILIMPQDFFMNCAILILVSIILLCIGCILYGLVPRWREKLATVGESEVTVKN